MVWTHEKMLQIPEEYRDFMLILKEVVDSKRPETILRVTGVHFSQLASLLTSRYEYNTKDVRDLADELVKANLVSEDRLGFFQPTPEGEALIAALSGNGVHTAEKRVPPFPRFKE